MRQNIQANNAKKLLWVLVLAVLMCALMLLIADHKARQHQQEYQLQHQHQELSLENIGRNPR